MSDQQFPYQLKLAILITDDNADAGSKGKARLHTRVFGAESTEFVIGALFLEARVTFPNCSVSDFKVLTLQFTNAIGAISQGAFE